MAEEAWPFALGESPFRVRAAAYAELVEFVDCHLSGGFVEALEDVDPAVLACFEELPGADAWLDLTPLVHARRWCARHCGLRDEQLGRKLARLRAERQLRTWARWTLRMAPARLLARRMPEVFGLQVDFAQVQALALDDGRVGGRIQGIPACLADHVVGDACAHAERVLELCAEGSRLRAGAPTVDGSEHGVDLVSVSFELELV